VYFYFHHEPYGEHWNRIRNQITPVRIDPPREIAMYRYQVRGMDAYRYAHLSDFVRLEQLLAAGGVYADIDTIFDNPIPSELFDREFVLGEEVDVYCARSRQMKPSLCNAFIMSAPAAPFGRIWLNEMGQRFDGSWSAHSCLLARELSVRYPDLIHVEPARTFYKHMWTREGLRTLLEDCDRDFEGVVSMHLWSHLWWNKRRTDFSPVHAGVLTSRHIRDVDTTYSIAARPFLPDESRRAPAGGVSRVFASLVSIGRR
jgi:hypothetical protein